MRLMRLPMSAVGLALTAMGLTVSGFAGTACALEPDDTPWGLHGTDPAGKPQSIEDLLARDQQSIIQDTDISPPGQDQPDLRGQPGAEDDRLMPKLPAEIHDAPARAPDTAIAPLGTAGLPPAQAPNAAPAGLPPATAAIPALRQAPPQAAVRAAAPPQGSPDTRPSVPALSSPQRAAVPPAAAQTGALPQTSPALPNPATPAAPSAPAVATPAVAPTDRAHAGRANAQARTQPQAPAQVPVPSQAPPQSQVPAAQAAAATAAGNPSAPASLAAPSQSTMQVPVQVPAAAPAQAAVKPEAMPALTPPPAVAVVPPPPAATATETEQAHIAPATPDAPPATAAASPQQPTEPVVAANGKLYLPLKRYFETRAAVALAEYDQADREALSTYYEKTVGETMWVDKSGFNAGAKAMIEEIRKADDWGLASADYKIPEIRGGSSSGGGDYDYDALADAEVKLSLAAMEYARHARGDRIDTPAEQLSSYLDRKPQLIERPKLLEALASSNDKGAYLRSLHPKNAQFERLQAKLLELRSAQKSGTEDEEPFPEGPKLTPGKSHPQIAMLRHRLGVTEKPVKRDGEPASDDYFDDALAQALVKYKEKNQIEPASTTFNNEVRRSLSKKTHLDERTILANMEQWRWMPDDLGETYVWVNIPEFMVRVKKHEAIIHEERIVTGRIETQTPIFSDKMRRVVFQPRWNVPDSIKVNELLPKLRDGHNPIAGQGLRLQRNNHDVDVWDVDWNNDDIRNYHIYQPPGDANVLGVVKFLFPNKHSVYLHDTPSKALFNEKVRTFSHGCMRVRNPVRLAEVIMEQDKGWDKEKVDDLVNNGPEENDVALERPIPVHVTYFTLWIDDNGEAKQFADVYGHEQRIKLGLEGRWDEIVKNRDHLLPPEDPGKIASREDWGDEDADNSRPQRRVRSADSYPDGDEDRPRRTARAQERSYKQVYPMKKKGGFSELLNNIFGN